MTEATAPAILPSRTASSIAVMFEPRPEIRMTSRFMSAGPRWSCNPLNDDRARRAGFCLLDRADEPGRLAQRCKTIDRGLGGVSIDNKHQTDAAVEYAVHLGARDVARALQPAENRRAGPARRVDARGEPGSEHAVRVFRQAAARDVRHA